MGRILGAFDEVIMAASSSVFLFSSSKETGQQDWKRLFTLTP